jgi:hypothetical protein
MWSPSGALLSEFKDPSIVNVDGTYHVFASTASGEGYNLVYFSLGLGLTLTLSDT